jgi:phosphatidate cytidylyltransferase
MLGERVLTAIFLVAIGIPAVILGGVWFYFVIIFFFCLAAWEYIQLFQVVDVRPSQAVTVGGVLAIITARAFFPGEAVVIFGGVILLAMTVHLISYELGRDHAGTDFAASVAGIVYIGWIGAYLIDIRNLPNGAWWLMLVFLSVWAADSGAYFIGVRWGTHRMTPRLSPKKTWEGYWGGAICSVVITVLIAYAYRQWGGIQIMPVQGAMLGLVLGMLPTLGDLGESMFKRQAGMKDSSNIFPGHGGAFDRIDSWIWGAILGFYFIVWFIL